MKKNKYKILVLSDLKNSVQATINNSMGLAKMLNADIDFFHVKKPIDVVDKANQLSAMRTLNSDFKDTDKTIKDILQPFTEEENINIKHAFVVGNVKNEIKNRIESYKPDLIVLGKRNKAPLKLVGDSITQFVLNQYKGAVLIAANPDAIEPDTEFTVGAFYDFKEYANNKVTENIIQFTNKPIKTFKISDQFEDQNISASNQIETVDYVFERGDSVIKNLSNYLVKSNINLLYVDRKRKEKGAGQKVFKSDFNNLIRKLDVSVLVNNA